MISVTVQKSRRRQSQAQSVQSVGILGSIERMLRQSQSVRLEPLRQHCWFLCSDSLKLIKTQLCNAFVACAHPKQYTSPAPTGPGPLPDFWPDAAPLRVTWGRLYLCASTGMLQSHMRLAAEVSH